MWIQTKGKFNLIRWLLFHFDAFALDFGSLTRCMTVWVRCALYMCLYGTQQSHKLCLLLSFDIFYMKKQSDRELKRNEEMFAIEMYETRTMDEKSVAMYAMPGSAANLIMQIHKMCVRLCVCVCVGKFYEIICLSLAFIFRAMFRFARERHQHYTHKEIWANCITMIMLLWGWKWKWAKKTWPSFNTLDVLCGTKEGKICLLKKRQEWGNS